MPFTILTVGGRGGGGRGQRIVLGENGISRGVRMGEYGAMLSGILHWNINNILFNI